MILKSITNAKIKLYFDPSRYCTSTLKQEIHKNYAFKNIWTNKH